MALEINPTKVLEYFNNTVDPSKTKKLMDIILPITAIVFLAGFAEFYLQNYFLETIKSCFKFKKKK